MNKSMQGTPWHVETLKMSEGDSRRHKSKCKYYNKGICENTYIKCCGSAHCDIYKEIIPKEENENIAQIKNKNKNIFGYFEIKFVKKNTTVRYIIGRNIEQSDKLVGMVAKYNLFKRFNYNGCDVVLTNKELRYKLKK